MKVTILQQKRLFLKRTVNCFQCTTHTAMSCIQLVVGWKTITWKKQLLTHSLNTDKGSSGAPLIDVSTKRVIAVHCCDVRSPESRNNWHLYPNGATNILPVVDYIKGISNFDYIVNTSTEQAESTDDADGRSVAASASARQSAGRPYVIISSNFNNNNSIKVLCSLESVLQQV
jgi:hypothetical protein